MSQRSEILKALKNGETLTFLDCVNRFGCIKARARISELRQEGWPIETKMVSMNGKRFAEWRLIFGREEA